MLTLSVLDRLFEPCLGQTKEYEIGICHFSAKQALLMSKSKYWLSQNQNIVSSCEDITTFRVLLQ